MGICCFRWKDIVDFEDTSLNIDSRIYSALIHERADFSRSFTFQHAIQKNINPIAIQLNIEQKEEEEVKNQEPISMANLTLQILKENGSSLSKIRSQPLKQICTDWFFDTLKIAFYTAKLIILCPCTYGHAFNQITRKKEFETCCLCTRNDKRLSVWCYTIVCGRIDAWLLFAIFLISLAPIIACIFLLLSIFGVIDDFITKTEAVLPFIALILFGKILLFSHLSNDLLHAIGVKIEFNDDEPLKQHCAFLSNVHFVTLHHTTSNMLNWSVDDLEKDQQKYDKRTRILSIFYGLLVGAIHFIERGIHHQYDTKTHSRISDKECNWYCKYVLFITFVINVSVMIHLGIFLGGFLHKLKIYKKYMTHLYVILLLDNEQKMVLHQSGNCNKWKRLWCIAQNKSFCSFQKYETALFGCCVAIFLCVLTIGYTVIDKIRGLDDAIDNCLFVTLIFVCIPFVAFILCVLYYSYSFSAMQSKQILALRAQQDLAWDLICTLHQTKQREVTHEEMEYLDKIPAFIETIIALISMRSLAPTVLGLPLDKALVVLVFVHLIAFIPKIFHVV